MGEPRRRENCDRAQRSMSPLPEKAPFPNITRPGQINARVVSGLTKNGASAASPRCPPTALFLCGKKLH